MHGDSFDRASAGTTSATGAKRRHRKLSLTDAEVIDDDAEEDSNDHNKNHNKNHNKSLNKNRNKNLSKNDMNSNSNSNNNNNNNQNRNKKRIKKKWSFKSSELGASKIKNNTNKSVTKIGDDDEDEDEEAVRFVQRIAQSQSPSVVHIEESQPVASFEPVDSFAGSIVFTPPEPFFDDDARAAAETVVADEASTSAAEGFVEQRPPRQANHSRTGKHAKSNSAASDSNRARRRKRSLFAHLVDDWRPSQPLFASVETIADSPPNEIVDD